MRTNAAQLNAIGKRGRPKRHWGTPTSKQRRRQEQDHIAAISILKTQGYREYLRTDHWRKLRNKKLKQIKLCEFCRRDWNLQVHHHTYERIGCEWLRDLVVVCDDCHEEIHAYQKANRWMTLTQATEAVRRLHR